MNIVQVIGLSLTFAGLLILIIWTKVYTGVVGMPDEKDKRPPKWPGLMGSILVLLGTLLQLIIAAAAL